MSPIPFVVLALCGLAFGAVRPVHRLDGRIAGGDSATIHDFPHQLSLRVSGHHFCGATIIGPNHALTAAHCVPDSSTEGLTVHAGVTYLSYIGSEHQVSKITVHPQYEGNDYDYAVIEVATPFPLGESGIRSVELCSVEPSAGQSGLISGWGAVGSEGGNVNQLHAGRVPIISREECQAKYSQDDITERMICTSAVYGGPCKGDSGGPVMVQGKLCGVVSWGIKCIDGADPNVYANVADQVSWIQETVGI